MPERFSIERNPARGMPVSANPTNNSGSDEEPETITDLSELSFDFEDAAPSNRRPAYGSAIREPDPAELSEELELLDSLSGQITGDGPPEFYCKPLGQLLGPMSLAELRIMAESGALAEDDLVRYGETGEWKPAASFARLGESLHRGSSITAEPVASAPPSTRRLFQTGYKPTCDSFGEDNSRPKPSIPTEHSATPAEAPETTPTTVAESVSVKADATASPANNPAEASGAADNSGATSESETETQTTESPRRKKPAKKSPAAKKAGKKPAGKKKPVKKRNDEDDAILNDIFSEVFADDQKTQRPAMPPAASSLSDAAARVESPSTSNETVAAKTPDAAATK
jgi:hypothetical protein